MLGPLFHKELLEVSRRARYYVARTLVGLVLLLGLWLAVRPFAIVTTGYGYEVSASMAQMSAVGRGVFVGWASLLLLGLYAFVPAVVSALVAGEKDGRTFEVLLTTCLEDREILVGKLASRLLLVLVMILSSFPAVAIAGLFGGFDLTSVAAATIVHGTVAVFVACLGLYYSTITRKAYVAAIRTYFVLAVIWYLIPRVLNMLIAGLLPGGTRINFVCIDPLAALAYAQRLDLSSASGFSTNFGLTTLTFSFANPLLKLFPLLLFAAMYLLLAAWLFLRSRRRLRRDLGSISDPFLLRLARGVFRRLAGLATGFVEARRDRRGLRRLWQWEQQSRNWAGFRPFGADSANPISMRNASANVYDPERYVASMQVAVWIGFYGMMLFAVWFSQNLLVDRTFSFLLLRAEAVALLVLTTVLAACAFARERQYGSLEVLLLSEINAGEFVGATLRGVWRTLWPTFGLFVLTAAFFGYTQIVSDSLTLWLVGVVACVRLVTVIGLALSLVSRRIGEAMVASLVTAVLVMFGVPILLRMVGYQGLVGDRGQVNYHALVAIILLLALVVAFLRLPGRARPRLAIWVTTIVVPLSAGILGDVIFFQFFALDRFALNPYDLVPSMRGRSITCFDYANRIFPKSENFIDTSWYPFILSVWLAGSVLIRILRYDFDRLAGRADSSLTPSAKYSAVLTSRPARSTS